jgi:hypothetical protein
MRSLSDSFKQDNQALIKFKQRLCTDVELQSKKVSADLGLILESLQRFAV